MKKLSIKGNGCTDIGNSRPLNEDYFKICDYLFVLADGIGGHNAGEIASKLAVDNIIDIINNNLIKNLDDKNYQEIIKNAINKTNEIVYKESLKKNELNGMGTTIVLALYQKPNIIHIANVGDSRAYLFRNGKLDLLTRDHSVTASMLRDGTIKKEEAYNHPYRHHLTQSIGTNDKLNVYTNFIEIIPEDKILLCSDGLWDVLTDKQIVDIIKKNNSPKKICQDLISQANNLKSQDNISSIIINISIIEE